MISIFFFSLSLSLSKEMNYEEWMTGLAFLVDVIAHLNNRNEELCRKNKLIAELYNSTKTYKVKL